MIETPAIIASGLPGKRDDAHRAGITMTDFMSGVNSNGGVGSWVWGVGATAPDDPSADTVSPTPHPPLPTLQTTIRRLIIIAAAIFVAVAAVSRLELLYSHKFFDNTGTAQWIWQKSRLAQGDS